jgi:hypothetical protein
MMKLLTGPVDLPNATTICDYFPGSEPSGGINPDDPWLLLPEDVLRFISSTGSLDRQFPLA